ncbi:MAG: signal peptidase I [Rectinemataceae bacterium]|jgi:signal peptidase I
MSRSKKAPASKAREQKPKNGANAYAGAARALPVLALAWIGLLIVTAVATLCPTFTVYYAVYIAVTLGLAAGALAFLRAIYRKGKTSLHPAFKKYLGYSLVLHYAAAALPRVDWAGDGLIGQGRVAYMFVLALFCLAAGLALFVASGRPAVYAALGLIDEAEVRDKALRKKRFALGRKKGFLHASLEWVDALGFAAILVILINSFVFQLYEIPSESMVPAFLKKDRPFTSKLTAGPRVPLTDWRLPFLKLPKRGDIITLANPRYPENRSVNLKKYLSQLVSMVTFTAVNIDKYLPDGSVKADPLVKRVVGLPGEKLMMIDDVLYAKRKGDQAFAPIEEDKTWASVDLWKLDPERQSHIELLPIDEKHRAVLSAWDAKRKAADPAALASSIAASARSILSKAAPLKAEVFMKELEKKRPAVYKVVADDSLAYAKSVPSADNLIAAAGTRADDLAIALAASSSPAFRAVLGFYASVPNLSVPAADAYARGGHVLNLLIKDNILGRAAREAELIASGATFDAFSGDATLAALNKDGGELDYYLNGQYAGLYDERNIPVFPAGDAYLGSQQYFAMGDNRYNSLDFRYRTGNFSIKPLDPSDPASVLYYSNIDPFALDLRFIEGYALFRIWPLSRVGAIR